MTSEMFVVDADSHWSEPADLFTRNAPAAFRDRVPHVEEVDGRQQWVFDGHLIGLYSASGVIDREGRKAASSIALLEWDHDQIHVGAWDPVARLAVLDECGIDAQVIYPSTIGLGGQSLAVVEDQTLWLLAIELYNDRMAEIQAESHDRLLPMPLMPAWDVDQCVAEAQRVADLGLRGVNMTSDPHDFGSPDLAHRAWDPFWEALSDLRLPVHFHIGASLTAMSFLGSYSWPSQPLDVQLAIGASMLFIGNTRIVSNLVVTGVFDRYPDLKMVSVESGVGWLPFILETLDHQMAENAPAVLATLERMPSEYFRSNCYATFWYERNGNRLPELIEAVGEDNILFETDWPHPTCLYPSPLETVAEKMATLPDTTRRKIMGENARELYRL